MRKNVILIIVAVLACTSCKEDAKEGLIKNSLLPEKLEVHSYLNLNNTFKRNEKNDLYTYCDWEYANKNDSLIKVICDNLVNSNWKIRNACAYKNTLSKQCYRDTVYPSMLSRVFRVPDQVKLDTSGYKDGISDPKLYADLKSTMIVDNWIFDREKFIFKKEALSFQPIVHQKLYSEQKKDSVDALILSTYVFPSSNIDNTNDLFLTLKYEHKFYELHKSIKEIQNSNNIISRDTPFLNSSNVYLFFREIMSRGLDKGHEIYDFETMESLNPKKVEESIKDFTMMKNGSFRICWGIHSVIFVEQWYTNEAKDAFRKEVLGVAPVFYREHDDKPLERIVPFYIKFNDDSSK
ncbi:MAG: hypothetical protein MI922_22650 [Bacteroidales bacterium]|nr:hypothetical protein [Bacteroidales bacterium]